MYMYYLLLQRYIDWCLPCFSTIDKSSTVSMNKTTTAEVDRGDIKRFKARNKHLIKQIPVNKPEDLIICETQESNFCGRHVLRAIAQRLDLFSDEYLMEVAENIAAQEQIFRHGERIRTTDYFYKYTGDYDIQILKAALMNIFKIDLLQIKTPETSTDYVQKLIISNIQHSQAFLIEKDYHYYCLRRFRLTKNYFFKIDSKSPMHHEPIHREQIMNFLHTLWEQSGTYLCGC